MIKDKVGETELNIGLDRLVLGLPYPKLPKFDAKNLVSEKDIALIKSAQKDYVATLKMIENTIKDTGSWVLEKTKNKDLKRYKVISDDDGGLICIFSLGFCFGTGVINLEVNPSKMNSDKWSELLVLLSLLFEYDYKEFYARAVVSHAEFYVDVVGEDLSNLVLIDEGRRVSTIYKGTTYKGRRASPLVCTMYDKAEQQHKNEKLVRIEARLNRNDMSFKDLVEKEQFNPFAKFMVVKEKQVQLIADKFVCPDLEKIIIEQGLYSGIKNKHALKLILKLLNENLVDWWKPEEFWAVHRKLLLLFVPHSSGKIGLEYLD